MISVILATAIPAKAGIQEVHDSNNPLRKGAVDSCFRGNDGYGNLWAY